MSADTMDPAPALPAPETRPPRARSGAPAAALIVALLALGLAAYVAWRSHAFDGAREGDAEQKLAAQVEALTHSVEQLRGNADSVRARLDDAAKVDRTEREEMLGLAERARLLEDAVANLADKRLSARDTLALDEAELLLTLGAERYTLFHDANAAIAAYRMADSALGEVENAAFSTVRQSVAAEIEALGAQRGGDVGALLSDLEQLSGQLQQLPTPQRTPTPEPAAGTSRLWRVLGALVQVRHDEDANVVLRDAALSRGLAALEVREAAAALLGRDDARYHARLGAARAELAGFDRSEPHVSAAFAALDKLDRAQLAPAPPSVLGAALKELRNLRATHALRSNAPARGAPAPAVAPTPAAKADEAHT